ncbi:MAG: hypothetical protein EOO46_02300 [Flavobacterium sp.]|nr:MAG: hypothetical protein EOO46_02300 [Flavobacterium sp.]
MTKTATLFFISSLLVLTSCKDAKSANKIYYQAINGKDTARLSVIYYEDRFFGQYERIYGKSGKDSGNVRGQLVGDTLKGEFKYLSFGGSKSIRPIVFLRKDNRLLLGKGLIATYMEIPFYVKEVPIDYNTGFVFEEINKQ